MQNITSTKIILIYCLEVSHAIVAKVTISTSDLYASYNTCFFHRKCMI